MRYTILAAATLVAALTAFAMPAEPAAQTSGATPISATMTARNAGSAQWFFAMAPDDVLPMLSPNTRLDMLDYFNSGLHRPSVDATGSRAIVTASTARSLSFETGDTTRFQIAVFPAARDTLVALITTVAYPMADSRVDWYNGRWQAVAAPVAAPRLADWLTPDGRRRRRDVEDALPFISAEAVADPEQGTLTLRHTMDAYFPAAERPEALQLIKPQIVQKVR